MAALRQVMDLELGCNIVDLGLVYGVESTGGNVTVTMTLTTRGCPMNDFISAGVEQALLDIDGVTSVDVRIVWEPAWTTDRMFPEARRSIGLAETGSSASSKRNPEPH